MESYAAAVRRVAGAALAGLAAVCLPASLVAAALLRGDKPPFSPGQIGELLIATLVVALVALVVGLFAVLLYGIPLYAALARKGWANYPSAAAIGGLPVLAFSAVQPHVSELSLAVYSVGTALATHWLVERAVAKAKLPANKSSKPTPLRGAA